MEIKLIINGEEQIFRNDFVSAKMLRKSFRLTDALGELEKSSSLTIEDAAFNQINDFMVELYDNQFTAEEFENGISHKEYMNTVGEQMGIVMGTIGEDDSKN